MRTAIPLAGLLLAACGSSTPETPPVNLTGPMTVTIAPAQATVAAGRTLKLSAVVRDSNGSVLTQAPVAWSVINPSLATVSASGLVSATTAGVTSVVASSPPAADTAALTVDTTISNGTLHVSFATFMGGTGDDMARDVAVDAQGNVYVAGSTQSPNFPTTPGAYDRTFNSSGQYLSDAFVAKFGPSGNLIWSTLVGGPNYERAYAIELDPLGYVYIAGRAGAGFPVTQGAFQTTFAGGVDDPGYGPQDGYICKLMPDGSAVVWCSYFGVNDGRIIRDIAVDGNGDVYVSSATNNGGFPAAWFTNAFQKTKTAGTLTDLIVAKVKTDGSKVLWATYIGGSGDEGNSPSIRVDAQGFATVVSGTTSTDMPTVNAAQSVNGGGRDFYIARLAQDGSSLVYATYLGGNAEESTETHGLALDAQGNAVVAGQTLSANFPTTSGVVQPTFGGGLQDFFVARYSKTGTKQAATFLGGNGTDGPQGVAVDGQGNVFVSGLATGTFPTTVPQLGPGGGADLTATELSPTLTSILYSIRIGGSGDEASRGAALDSNGGFHLVGHTVSPDMYHLNAVQPSIGGAMDALVISIIP